MTRSFLISMSVTVDIDDAVIDAVLTDEWRKQFYPFYTAADVAEHLAFNLAQGCSLSSLDGFADQADTAARVHDIDIDSVEELP